MKKISLFIAMSILTLKENFDQLSEEQKKLVDKEGVNKLTEAAEQASKIKEDKPEEGGKPDGDTANMGTLFGTMTTAIAVAAVLLLQKKRRETE